MSREDWTLGRGAAALLAVVLAVVLWLTVHLERATHDSSVVEAAREAAAGTTAEATP
ncbi:hypothetical protein [Roseisolibacter sp. H3M3-2]|uniref:hypothetical protein n=1 Tax=Roseisolibacter sp. H3M3-2 TaxID=3031323 RepID=UPI0023DA693A|nr:hypothetical protein [Roseisolibacter sp. H3M3-2]MDF1503876.1 hypothetical protein [Roseisolibacter sp. H3M3-2]